MLRNIEFDKEELLGDLLNQDGFDGSEGMPLYEAARHGHIEIVNQLLTQKTTDKMIESALTAALSGNHPAVAKTLITKLSKINLNKLANHINFGGYGELPNPTECLQVLFDHGLNPNEQLMHGSLLSHAVENGNIEAVRFLLRKGATPSLERIGTGLSGPTQNDALIMTTILDAIDKPSLDELVKAVYYAIMINDINMIRSLVQRGARLDGQCLSAVIRKHSEHIVTLNGEDLQPVIRKKAEELFAIMLTEYRDHFSNEDFIIAIAAAIENNEAAILEELYSRLNSPNADDFAQHLTYRGHFGYVKPIDLKILVFLLNNKLNPNCLIDGETLLAKAASSENIEACRELLKSGANPNIQQTHNPLISAVKAKDFDLVKLLLENGASVDVKTSKGQGPIGIARQRRYADILIELLKYSKDSNDLMEMDDSKDGNRFIIHVRFLAMAAGAPGVFFGAFSFLIKEPEIMSALPGGMKANCNYTSLKDIFLKLKDPLYDLPDGLVDMGGKPSGKEMDEIDFYYECDGLDRNTIERAISILKSKYKIRDSKLLEGRSPEEATDEDLSFAKELLSGSGFFEPVTAITEALLQAAGLKVQNVNTGFGLFASSSDDDKPDFNFKESGDDDEFGLGMK